VAVLELLEVQLAEQVELAVEQAQFQIQQVQQAQPIQAVAVLEQIM
jgi:hypothetical protein